MKQQNWTRMWNIDHLNMTVYTINRKSCHRCSINHIELFKQDDFYFGVYLTTGFYKSYTPVYISINIYAQCLSGLWFELVTYHFECLWNFERGLRIFIAPEIFWFKPKKKNRLINVPTEVADNKCLIKFLSVAQLHVLAIFIERDIFRGIPRVESRTLDHQRGTIYLNYENRQDKFIRCINQYGYLLLFVLVPGKCSYVKKLVWETSTTAGKLSRRRIRFI